MTAALLGWTTFMILDGKGMASMVGERHAMAALLGGRELDNGCPAGWESVGRRLPCWMDGRKLNDSCPAWGGGRL